MKIQRLLSFLLVLTFLPGSRSAHAFCFEEAGAIYGVSPQLLWAISRVESSHHPWALNLNGKSVYPSSQKEAEKILRSAPKDVDIGLMQVSSWWVKKGKISMDLWRALWDPCTNVKVGAWILADCFYRYGYTWEAVGCYNAKNPEKRKIYIKKIVTVMREHGLIK